MRSLRMRRRRSSSSESASSRSSSGGTRRRVRDQLRLGEKESENREALLALRAERAQVSITGANSDLVEMGSGTCRAAFDVPVEPSLERGDRRQLRVVAERGILEAELGRALRESGLEELDHVCRERRSGSRRDRRPEPSTATGHRGRRGRARRVEERRSAARPRSRSRSRHAHAPGRDAPASGRCRRVGQPGHPSR